MRENLIVAAILTAGAVIRFYRLDLTWFFLDQARDVAAAAGIAAGASFPLLGPRVGWTEAYLGPLYFYLMAIPFSIARDPVAGAAFVAAGHLVALLALYRFAREFFGPRVAASASALFAVFPLTIFSSRLVWHAGLLPPLTVLYMHALYRLVVRGHSASVVPLLGLLAALTQLHLTSIALAGVALTAVLLFRPRLRIGHVLGGAALFLFLYLPYVVYEVGHRFENVRALSRFGASAEGLAPLDGLPRVVGNLLLLFSPALSGFVLAADWSPAFLAGFWILYHVEAALFGIGLVLCISRLLMGGRGVGADQGAERRQMALLLLWVSVPVLILGGKKTALWWYYLDVVYPSPFVLAGLAIASAPSLVFRGALGRKHAARALAGLAAAIVVSQAYFQLNFQRKVVARGEMVVAVPRLSINAAASPFETLVTLPLGYRRDIVRALVREFGVEPEAFYRKVHGAVLGLAEENRYLVAYLSPPHGGPRGARPAFDPHYLVARAAGGDAEPGATRSRRIGPYVIIERRPIIDYESWRCAVTIGGVAGIAEWTRLRVPAADAALTAREGERLWCRGRLDLPPSGRGVRVAVSVLGWAPFDAVALQVGSRRLAPVARERRQDPLMLKAPSGWSMGIGWASETVFDLTGSAPPGESVVTIELAGVGQIIGFDVYEGRSW